MNTIDYIVIGFIVIIISLSIIKIIREKKKGSKCITCVGCPHSKDCSSNLDIK